MRWSPELRTRLVSLRELPQPQPIPAVLGLHDLRGAGLGRIEGSASHGKSYQLTSGPRSGYSGSLRPVCAGVPTAPARAVSCCAEASPSNSGLVCPGHSNLLVTGRLPPSTDLCGQLVLLAGQMSPLPSLTDWN